MQYFLQSGRIPDLSYAELFSVLESVFRTRNTAELIRRISDKVFLVTLPVEKQGYDLAKLFYRLGGFIRIGEIIEDQDTFLASFEQKNIDFGISIIQNDKPAGALGFKDIKTLSSDIKKNLKAHEMSARFVLPMDDEIELNSAQVIKNDLVKSGFELCLLEKFDGEYLTGRTLAVQDIDDYAKRDFERPYADKKMGMLPPKLARMMVNLAGLEAGSTIWDPFCGSGTILMEALTLGYSVLGSDINSNATFFSEENIKWLATKYNFKDQKYNIFQLDVTKPDKKIVSLLRNTSIQGIVFEPFMGPPQKRMLTVKKAENLINTVLEQYKALITLIEAMGLRKITVVMVVPSYKTFDGWVAPRINQLLSKRWQIINKKFGRDLQYRRSNSIISRNILILQNS